MPRLTGIFSEFKDLEKLNAQDLNQWLKVRKNPTYLENYIANRLLYPQTIPVSQEDLEIDLAILREYIRRHPEIVYNPKPKKMLIKEELEVRFPPLQKLIGAILDVVALEGITPIIAYRINGVAEVIGTIISHQPAKEGFTDINVGGKILKLEANTVTILPNKEKEVIVQVGQLPGITISGGSLGVVIDLRKVMN